MIRYPVLAVVLLFFFHIIVLRQPLVRGRCSTRCSGRCPGDIIVIATRDRGRKRRGAAGDGEPTS